MANGNTNVSNVDKMKFLLFSYRKSHILPRVMIENSEIEQIHEAKFLGLLLVERLN